jgi:hypothetical protein
MKRLFNSDVPNLLRLAIQPGFVLLDLLGSTLLCGSVLSGGGLLSTTTAAVGTVILTTGLSLPIGLFYQLQENHGASRLLRTLNRTGVEDSFESRYEERARYYAALGTAFTRSTWIKLRGIALSDFFSGTAPDTEAVRHILEDPRVELEVAILDPGCEDATQRAEAERGHTTIEDIRSTLGTGLPVLALTRVRSICNHDPEFRSKIMTASADLLANGGEWPGSLVEHIRAKCKLEVHLLNSLPTAYLALCDVAAFSEQYVRGGPEGFREAECIGKHMPVQQFGAGSVPSRTLKGDFNFQWGNSEDCTDQVIREALDVGFRPNGRVLGARQLAQKQK